MPYDNKLNRSIAEQTRKNNEAYIKNTLNSYDVGDSNVGYANKKLIDENNIEEEQKKYTELEGGAYGARGGFGEGTYRDTGFGKCEGAGKYMNNEVHYDNNENNQYGGSFWSSLKKGFSAIAKPASAVLSLVPLPQAQLASKALGVAANLAGGKKKRVRKPKSKEPQELLLTREVGGAKKTKKNLPSIDFVGELDKTLKVKKSVGRPKKMKGSGGDGLVEPYNMIRENNTTGDGKPQRTIGGRKLTPVANMKSSSMAGQGKKEGEKRTDVVKRIMKERGVSMCKASSIVKNEKLY